MTQAAFLFTITLYAYNLTKDEATAGIVNSLYTIPLLLFMLLAGVIIDRISRRKILIVVNIIRITALFTVAGAIIYQFIRIEYLYVAAFLFGLGNSLNIPASKAFMPSLVKRNDYLSANTLVALVFRGTLVFGAVIGNELIRRVSIVNVFLLLALFCGGAIACLMLISAKEQLSKVPHTPNMLWDELCGGFLYTLSVPWLWITVGLFSLLNISIYGPWNIGLPLLSRSTMPGGALGLSII